MCFTTLGYNTAKDITTGMQSFVCLVIIYILRDANWFSSVRYLIFLFYKKNTGVYGASIVEYYCIIVL